jgi:hypothetical protein
VVNKKDKEEKKMEGKLMLALIAHDGKKEEMVKLAP